MKELAWLASQMGMARDLDVFIDEGLGGVRGMLPLPGEDKLMALAIEHRARSYETVAAMIDSERYAMFKQEFAVWLDEKGWEQGELTDKQRKRRELAVEIAEPKRLTERATADDQEIGRRVELGDQRGAAFQRRDR